MRMLMWTLTIIFSLAGLTLWVDHGASLGFGPHLGELFAKGLFFLAFLACPFLWAFSYGFVPHTLQVSGKSRFFMGLAVILAVPLVLPWH
jgi:hypothetical protein